MDKRESNKGEAIVDANEKKWFTAGMVLAMAEMVRGEDVRGIWDNAGMGPEEMVDCAEFDVQELRNYMPDLNLPEGEE